MNPFIHSLHVYPIKSCQGIELETAELVETGIRYDRHWMLVDNKGNFLSQRQLPQMARITTHFTSDSLRVNMDKQPTLELPLSSNDTEHTRVTIWNDECRAALVSAEASDWFSHALGIPCELVFLPESEHRQVDLNFAADGTGVGFADGFPLLVLSRATIDQLNSKLEDTVCIDRFRANIIIDGCEAHEEDEWSKITVGDIDILLCKPCSRCVIPSIDQHSGEKHAKLLSTLAGYRRTKGKVYVGQNGLHLSQGTITRAQSIQIQRKQPVVD